MESTTPSPSNPHAIAIAQFAAKYAEWEREIEAITAVDPEPDESVRLAFELVHMGKAFEYHLFRSASGSVMTALQGRFAWILATSRGGVPMPNIEVTLGISRAAVCQMVARMSERGLVTCTLSPTDGRTMLVALTPEGHEQWAAVKELLVAVTKEIGEAVGRRSTHHFAKKVAAVTALDERHDWYEMLRNPSRLWA